MNRISYMEIAGKQYPLSFSLGATKAISKRFGSTEKMISVLTEIKDVDENTIDDLSFIIEALIKNGCEYMNIFCKNDPVPENAPVEDGKYIPLSAHEIEVGIQISECGDIISAISGCMSKSQETEIEAESWSKNASAPEE